MGIRLGEICQFQSGGTPSRKCPEYFNGDIPWVTTTALNGGTISFDDANELITLKAIEESAAKLVPAHSILVGTRVGVGKTAINLIPMSTSQDIISLTEIDEQKWYKEFICKLISSKQNYLVSKARGATIKGIKIETLADLEIPEISISEQHFIVSIFDKLNFLILSRKQQLTKLDELVKARFVEMFDNNYYPKVLFDDVCTFLRNGANIKQTKGASGYPITRIETLSNDVFNVDRLGYADITDLEKYRSYVLHNGDILISHINSVAYLGRAVQYRGQLDSPIIHGMNLLCARIADSYSPTYIEWFFKTSMAKEYIASITKKAVNQASITTSDLKKMKVPNPPIDLQNQFATFVEQVDKSKVAVQKALDEAQTLFDSLMQQYFG